MAFGNNRAALKPRASFQVAGGVIMKYRHPKLAGQISNATQIDEIDVSRSVKLNDTYLSANPAQDSSFMETLVDGSVIIVTNHMLAGQMAIQVVRTTGLVGTGDFIAAAHLVIASKDSEGGTYTVIENIDGKRLITVFYGVAFKNVPHLIKAGNAVVTYPMVLNYAGWFQGVGSEAMNEQAVWAVGNKYGLKAVFKPYAVQAGEAGADFYSGIPASTIGGVDGTVDSADGDIDNDSGTSGMAAAVTGGEGVLGTPAPTKPTW
jgi:hypothetical protein